MMICFPVKAFEKNTSKVYTVFDPTLNQEITVFDFPDPVNIEIQPHAEHVCHGFTYHDMVQKGMGTAVNSKDELIIYNACFFQCSRCHQVMLTSGNPRLGQIIYLYAVWNTDVQVNTPFVYVRTDYYNVCNSSTMSGYQFR